MHKIEISMLEWIELDLKLGYRFSRDNNSMKGEFPDFRFYYTRSIFRDFDHSDVNSQLQPAEPF